MTLKEFFAKARRGRKWYGNPGQVVVCDQGFCPLGAVITSDAMGIRYARPPIGAHEVRALKLPKGAARKIANAADFPRSKNRRWLLKNLGVA